MSRSIVPEVARISDIDYGHNLLGSLIADASRKPYVLARVAIAQYGKPEFSETAHKSIMQLHAGDCDGVLQPPLTKGLANEIEAFLVDAHPRFGVGSSNLAALALLAMAVDEGSRPNA